jgi:sialic acid synthase SpsE
MKKLSILHCVSQYPTAPQNANLRSITYLKNAYPQYTIGYSDHTIGISAPVAAVALGAQIIEKHITLDRQMKGTDQAGSLGIDGINRMVRDIRLMELSLGEERLFIDPVTQSVKEKLERSIATKRAMQAGEIIQESDIHLLSPGDGVKWNARNELLGRKLKADIGANEVIYKHLLSKA